MYGILLQRHFLCSNSCVVYVYSQLRDFFHIVDVDTFLLLNQIMRILADKYFKAVY